MSWAKFHPHGDGAIYDALVRMAQDFTMRYPLIDGQGNFGSIDGDPPAQMRYTEARLAQIAAQLLGDIDRDTVDFQPNFDDTTNEPLVLPALLPNMLINGASGIAVGMATNIPPHNLNEICDALIAVLADPDLTVDQLLEIVKGPDFPTGATIFNLNEIRSAFATGRGKITMQATLSLEETVNGRSQIIVSELPYQVNKATLLERIADLVRSKRIDDISDIRDESDRHGMRVVIELGRSATYPSVRNQLYKHTALRSTFAVNMLALDGGQPKTLTLKQALTAFIDHRREVIRRRTEFDLEKAQERAHILDGLRIALELLDQVITTIRASDSADAAKTALMEEPFELSDRQAQAVLDMQLRRLAALERQRIEDEYQELSEFIGYLENLLGHPEKIDALIEEDCLKLKEEYGDERRTQVVHQAVEDISEEDLVPHQQIVVTISDRGYMKRVPWRPTGCSAAAAAASPARRRAKRTPSATSSCATPTTHCCSSPRPAASIRCAASKCPRPRDRPSASRSSTSSNSTARTASPRSSSCVTSLATRWSSPPNEARSSARHSSSSSRFGAPA